MEKIIITYIHIYGKYINFYIDFVYNPFLLTYCMNIYKPKTKIYLYNDI